jgi:hypothetical protein
MSVIGERERGELPHLTLLQDLKTPAEGTIETRFRLIVLLWSVEALEKGG